MANEMIARPESWATGIYCSLNNESDEDRKLIYSAMNTKPERLADHINEPLAMKDLYIEEIELPDNDGVVRVCKRIVIITASGDMYGCVSNGIYNALCRIVALFGAPTWEKPIDIVVRQRQGKGANSYLTIDLV